MNLLKNKKHTETKKETTPLKMKRGQKKQFALYAVMVLTFCNGATCVYACKRDPGSDHGLGSETRRGAMRNAGSPLTFAGWEVKLFE